MGPATAAKSNRERLLRNYTSRQFASPNASFSPLPVQQVIRLERELEAAEVMAKSTKYDTALLEWYSALDVNVQACAFVLARVPWCTASLYQTRQSDDGVTDRLPEEFQPCSIHGR